MVNPAVNIGKEGHDLFVYDAEYPDEKSENEQIKSDVSNYLNWLFVSIDTFKPVVSNFMNNGGKGWFKTMTAGALRGLALSILIEFEFRFIYGLSHAALGNLGLYEHEQYIKFSDEYLPKLLGKLTGNEVETMYLFQIILRTYFKNGNDKIIGDDEFAKLFGNEELTDYKKSKVLHVYQSLFKILENKPDFEIKNFEEMVQHLNKNFYRFSANKDTKYQLHTIDINEDLEIIKQEMYHNSELGYSIRLALKYGMPFLILGMEISEKFKQELEIIDEANPNTFSGMSQTYLEERFKIFSDILSEKYSEYYVKEYEKGIPVPFTDPFTKEVIVSAFGSDDSDELNTEYISIPKEYENLLTDPYEPERQPPSVKQAFLFGGAGKDILTSDVSGAYLEGGIDEDEYKIQSAHYNTIYDIDGKGKIKLDNRVFNYEFDYYTENSWATKDFSYSAIKNNNDLDIMKEGKNIMKIKSYFTLKEDLSDGIRHLGIKLLNEPEVNPYLYFGTPERYWKGIGERNTFYSGGQKVKYDGNSGTDQVFSAMNQGMVADLGDGNDIFHGHIQPDVVFGRNGNDIIRSSTARKNEEDHDHFEGGFGRNLISGGYGNDIIYATESLTINIEKNYSFEEFGSWLVGEDNNDQMHGSMFRDIMMGGADKDIMKGYGGSDLMLGDGNLMFNYSARGIAINAPHEVTHHYQYNSKTNEWGHQKDSGFYILKIDEKAFEWTFSINEKGDYEIEAPLPIKNKKDGHLVKSEGDSADNMDGGDGDDFMLGQSGDDDMFGGRGKDIMFGDDNRDKSIAGSDYMNGGAGKDKLFGGLGDDIYVFNPGNEEDEIFDDGGDDMADLSLFKLSELLFGTNGSDLFIQSEKSEADTLIVKNFKAEENKIEHWYFNDGAYLTHQDLIKFFNNDNHSSGII